MVGHILCLAAHRIPQSGFVTAHKDKIAINLGLAGTIFPRKQSLDYGGMCSQMENNSLAYKTRLPARKGSHRGVILRSHLGVIFPENLF